MSKDLQSSLVVRMGTNVKPSCFQLVLTSISPKSHRQIPGLYWSIDYKLNWAWLVSFPQCEEVEMLQLHKS